MAYILINGVRSIFVTIVETHSFYKASRKILKENEIEELKSFIALNPEEGEVIPNLKGIRKLRWRANQKGKSGGARVIYFFYNKQIPVFLLYIYPKSEKSDLSASEKKLLNKLVDELIDHYGG